MSRADWLCLRAIIHMTHDLQRASTFVDGVLRYEIQNCGEEKLANHEVHSNFMNAAFEFRFCYHILPCTADMN